MSDCLPMTFQFSVSLDLLPNAWCNLRNNRRGSFLSSIFSSWEDSHLSKNVSSKRTKGKLSHFSMDKERAQHQGSVKWTADSVCPGLRASWVSKHTCNPNPREAAVETSHFHDPWGLYSKFESSLGYIISFFPSLFCFFFLFILFFGSPMFVWWNFVT